MLVFELSRLVLSAKVFGLSVLIKLSKLVLGLPSQFCHQGRSRNGHRDTHIYRLPAIQVTIFLLPASTPCRLGNIAQWPLSLRIVSSMARLGPNVALALARISSYGLLLGLAISARFRILSRNVVLFLKINPVERDLQDKICE